MYTFFDRLFGDSYESLNMPINNYESPKMTMNSSACEYLGMPMKCLEKTVNVKKALVYFR